MSTRKRITLPTTAPLPGSLRIPPTNPAALKALLKLSRPSLLGLVQEWLKPANQASCGPVLGDAETDVAESPYDVVQTLDEVGEIYGELEARKGSKREVADRILEGDWRHGLSLRQMAMLDVRYLLDHQKSQRWTARRIARITQQSKKEESEEAPSEVLRELPRFHGRAFIANLQQQLGSVLKAHYYLTHLRTLPLSLLRICVHESPYNSQTSIDTRKGGASSFKTVYLAFPDHSQFVYIATAVSGQPGPSLSSASDIRKLVIDATSRALSSKGSRYTLKSTSLSAKSLPALLSLRGPETTNAASGGWSIFSEGSVDPSPLAAAASGRDTEDDEGKSGIIITEAGRIRKRPLPLTNASAPHEKRRRKIAQARFGNSALPDDNKAIDRLDLRLENVFSTSTTREALGPRDENTTPRTSRSQRSGKAAQASDGTENDSQEDDGDSPWRPRIELTFHGTHIFAGIRALVEGGAVDGAKMPGWMTGENGVSTGVVRDGLVRGRKGAGF